MRLVHFNNSTFPLASIPGSLSELTFLEGRKTFHLSSLQLTSLHDLLLLRLHVLYALLALNDLLCQL